MADLVRALVNNQEVNVSRAWAEARELKTLDDEPTHNGDGTVRRTTRKGGRPMKKKTTVATEAAAKKAAVTEPAPDQKGTDQ